SGGTLTTTTANKYSIINFPIGISDQFERGTLGDNNESSAVHYFYPDNKLNASYFGINPGDYLKATLKTDATISYLFRITHAGSTALKRFNVAPTALTAGTNVVFPTTTVITTSEFVANSSFLVGQHKLYPDVVKVFKISGQTNAYTLTLAACPDFTVGSVASGDLPNFNWSIWDSPPNSLTLEVDTTDFTTVSTTPKNYYFSIINTADFYVSGKTEITILNHISDA